MRDFTLSEPVNSLRTPEKGDYYLNTEEDMPYIVADLPDGYALIGAIAGDFWAMPVRDITKVFGTSKEQFRHISPGSTLTIKI